MTAQKALELLKAEQECVQRNIDRICDRDCAKCDLVQEDADLQELYEMLVDEYTRKAWRERLDLREEEITYNQVNALC